MISVRNEWLKHVGPHCAKYMLFIIQEMRFSVIVVEIFIAAISDFIYPFIYF